MSAIDVWKLFGVMVDDLSQALDPDWICTQLASTGGKTWLAAQLTNGNQDRTREAPRWKDACDRHGVIFGMWGVTYTDPVGEARLMEQAIATSGCAFGIVNAEAPYMDDGYGRTKEFLQAFGKASVPMAISTLGGAWDPWTYTFDYQAWLGAGYALLPQAYYNDHEEYRPDLCAAASERAGYPPELTHLTLGIYNGEDGFLDMNDYYPLCEGLGLVGYNVFLADYMGEHDFAHVPAWYAAGLCSETGDDPVPDTPETPWYDKPYPGGPMVAVKGFPRPLYPPDAAPKHQASTDGPDVEAYKRTISRAGRWKWQKFDQAYSNAFSHGKGGNVVDTGVEGVQRQGGLDDTGYIGQKTFNLLRSIKIPEGLPHAGEMAMDATSIELINKAWDRFEGNPAPPPPSGTSAQARLKKATSYLGTRETPANSNKQPFGEWYGMNGVPWCAIFCAYCDQLGDVPSHSFAKGRYYSYVPYIVGDARMGANGLTITSTPKPGDLVCYDWDGDGEFDHVGIFETGNTGSWKAIEGNTSTSDNSNGGEVMRRSRSAADAKMVVFVRVAEP